SILYIKTVFAAMVAAQQKAKHPANDALAGCSGMRRGRPAATYAPDTSLRASIAGWHARPQAISLAVRLRRNTQIGAHRLVTLGELLLDKVFVLQAGNDDDIVALL